MKFKYLASLSLLLVAGLIGSTSIAEARHFNQSCGNGNKNAAWGWGRPGWSNNFHSGINPGYAVPAFPGNANSRWQQAQRLNNQSLQIQQRLASGNLNPKQVSRLRNRLAAIQGQQTQLSGVLSSGLTTRQQQLQQLLNSGTLNPNQTRRVQNLLTQLQNQQNPLGSGSNLFANTGFLGDLRGFLGI